MTPTYNEVKMIAMAECYHELGLAVIPFHIDTLADVNGVHDKKPIIPAYKHWETRPQTDAEFKELNWSGCNGFGVILGQQATNGYYLAVIDYDTKNNYKTPDERDAYNKAVVIGKEIFNEFPTTKTEKTVNDGLHKLYWCKTQPKIDGSFHDVAALELLGYPKLCVMTPSYGYDSIGSDVTTEIENLEEKFYNLLKKHGFLTDNDEQQKQDTATFNISKLIDLTKLEDKGDGVYQGSHPIHDSTTEKNFSVDTKRNIWFCFRHNSGGGALQYLAMREGLINCEQCKKGALRGKKFKEVVQIAISLGLLSKDAFSFDKELSQADRLVNLFLDQDIELFFDQHNTAYTRICLEMDTLRNCAIARLPVSFNPPFTENEVNNKQVQSPKVADMSQVSQLRNIANVTMPLGSSQFKNYLAYLFWQSEAKTPGTDALTSAINVLKGKAQNEGKQYRLYNRVAPAENGEIWLDTCDNEYRAVKITKEGWEIVTDPPILFKRYAHQQPLIEPLPKEQGDAWKFLKYVNIKETDTNNQLMLLVSAISYLIPDIAHPNIVAAGGQGCAKSYLFMLIRRLCDPSSIELLRIPKTEDDLALQLDHHWILPYDNISYLPKWASDTLCTGITGGGIEKRKLYTDDDAVIFQFKRCVMLNGINIAAQNGDLLDRSLIFTLEPIEPENRKTEAELNKAFDKDKAIILTGFLNVLSKALKLLPVIELEKRGKQRLSDFDVYGCAIAEALGKTQKEFIAAYAEKVLKQNEEALNSDPVALAVLRFAEKEVKGKGDVSVTGGANDYWKATPTELYLKLNIHAQAMGIDLKSKAWVKNANSLMRRLNLAIPALKAQGVTIESFEGNPRKISIDAHNLKVEKPTEPPEQTPLSFEERTKNLYDAIKKNGLVKIATVTDKQAYSQLLRENKIFEPQTGYVAPTEA